MQCWTKLDEYYKFCSYYKYQNAKLSLNMSKYISKTKITCGAIIHQFKRFSFYAGKYGLNKYHLAMSGMKQLVHSTLRNDWRLSFSTGYHLDVNSIIVRFATNSQTW